MTSKELIDYYDHALALIAGGWSTYDKEQIKKEYNYTEEEIEIIINYMKNEELTED